MHSGKDQLLGGISLNENPAIPDTTGLGSSLTNQNTAAPVVNIGAMIINGNAETNTPKTLQEQLNHERGDTSQYL